MIWIAYFCMDLVPVEEAGLPVEFQDTGLIPI